MEPRRRGRPRHPDILTPAEWRVLDALREGGTNAEIAARLGLSPDTVKTHISHMLAKLGLRNRRALAAWRPEREHRGAGGWLGLLVRPAVGLAAAGGIVAVAVVFAIVISGSRDDAAPTDTTPTASPAPDTALTVSPAPALNLDGCSGVAVTNPEANAELVADCEALLGLRDTIRGTRTLDWTGSKAMSDWTGVIIAGTPPRVTSLNLSDLGLDGELSGLLGNLTSLTTLDLSGNPLTGMLPSKLALLENLTTVSVAGTSFTGCAPPVLRTAATNDVTASDCGAPSSTRDLDRREPVPAGTYVRPARSRTPELVFDIPPGSGLVLVSDYREAGAPVAGNLRGTGPAGILFTNAEGTIYFSIDILMMREWGGRGKSDTFTGTGTVSGLSWAEYEEIFDRILESLWRRAE
ncbi:MAG: hypothetical protein F4Z96_02365 [Chloroflexi bacterium]|nr:hypothetical protein [Chloroflexota bacterium]